MNKRDATSLTKSYAQLKPSQRGLVPCKVVFGRSVFTIAILASSVIVDRERVVWARWYEVAGAYHSRWDDKILCV